MLDAELIPWIFASILAVGLIYMLFSIFFGGLVDVDADLDLDMDFDIGGDAGVDIGGDAEASSEARGIGCSVISSFMVGFGSMGLIGSLSGASLIFSILSGLIFGLIFGRTMLWALRFVLRQQSNDLMTTNSLIGTRARMTINTPAGKVGEALVEADSLIKYPVVSLDKETPLNKGDYVEVVDVMNGRLLVKKRAD